jgi:hypothetical protein
MRPSRPGPSARSSRLSTLSPGLVDRAAGLRNLFFTVAEQHHLLKKSLDAENPRPTDHVGAGFSFDAIVETETLKCRGGALARRSFPHLVHMAPRRHEGDPALMRRSRKRLRAEVPPAGFRVSRLILKARVPTVISFEL